MSKPEPANRKDASHLVAELESLHRSLVNGPEIPVLVEAVLDTEEETPDLAQQIDLVDSLLGEDLAPAQPAKPAQGPKSEPPAKSPEKSTSDKPTQREIVLDPSELQLDLGYDLESVEGTDTLPEDPGANDSLSQVHDDPLNYTGDDLFINHEDRERHFTDEPMGFEDTDEPPLLELEDALPDTAAKLDTVFKALSNPIDNQDDENPFLPAHLREKLRRSKATLMEEIQRSSDAVHQSSALIKAYTTDTQLKNRDRSLTPPLPEMDPNQALIDELVAEFLPKIEARLREKLAEQLAGKLGGKK